MDLLRIARGGTPIELDRTRVLFFDKKATWLLVQKFGIDFVAALYLVKELKPATGKKDAETSLELKDIDALAFFLYAGLLAEAEAKDEELTLDQVGDFLTPMKLKMIFLRVVLALTRGIETPPEPGKADAAAAGGAVAAGHPPHPGPLKASTTRKRSASPTPSSGRRRTSSGRKR